MTQTKQLMHNPAHCQLNETMTNLLVTLHTQPGFLLEEHSLHILSVDALPKHWNKKEMKE